MNPELIEAGEVVHGGFNLIMAMLFMYQGLLGIRIRRQRLSGDRRDPGIIKRHRRFGPILVPLGIAGFFAGLSLVMIDKGRILAFPLHFTGGLVVALLIVTTFLISRKISAKPDWRTLHAAVGGCLLFFYIIQVIIGIGVAS